MADKQPLPPLPKEVYDGEHYEAPIPKDQKMPKKCNHKGVKLISAIELRCECGSGWSGPNIQQLYELFRKQ